jgi:hypothetical protein
MRGFSDFFEGCILIDLSQSQSTQLTTASTGQIQSRNELWDRFRSCHLPDAELERSLGLFVRGSLLARFFAISDVYKRIVNIPGDIFDLGTWYGQNAVLSENCRAIYEPFNKQRRIVCFDTFEGYQNWSDKDVKSTNYQEKTYATGLEYADFLRELLELHEGNNALGHMKKRHEVVVGDATQSVAQHLKVRPNTIVALAYLDLGLYGPTKKVLEDIKPHLIPGSVLLFLQLTRDELPGDSVAFREVLQGLRYDIEKSPIYPSFTIVTIRS